MQNPSAPALPLHHSARPTAIEHDDFLGIPPPAVQQSLRNMPWAVLTAPKVLAAESTLPQTLKSVGERNHVSSMYVVASLGWIRWLCRRGVIRQYRFSHTRRKPANLSTCMAAHTHDASCSNGTLLEVASSHNKFEVNLAHLLPQVSSDLHV